MTRTFLHTFLKFHVHLLQPLPSWLTTLQTSDVMTSCLVGQYNNSWGKNLLKSIRRKRKYLFSWLHLFYCLLHFSTGDGMRWLIDDPPVCLLSFHGARVRGEIGLTLRECSGVAMKHIKKRKSTIVLWMEVYNTNTILIAF